MRQKIVAPPRRTAHNAEASTAKAVTLRCFPETRLSKWLSFRLSAPLSMAVQSVCVHMLAWVALWILVSADRLRMADASGFQATQCSEALLTAAMYGDEPQLLFALNNASESPACTDDQLRTPLHMAANEGQMSTVLLLLSAGAVMDRDVLGRTPLHSAVIAGQLNITSLLLDFGAYIELQDYAQRTPLHHAARYGYDILMSMLLNRGARIDARDGDLRTALHFSVQTDLFINATKLLVSRGADVHSKDAIGFTPLHFACYQNQIETVKFLIDVGADLYETDSSGWNPLSHAAAHEYTDLVDFLVVYLLEPERFPLPDPAEFSDQDFTRQLIPGIPAWLIAIAVVASVAGGIVVPMFCVFRRFAYLNSPYKCDSSDAAIEVLLKVIMHELETNNTLKLGEEWDSIPAHTLGDLHRVKH